MLIDINCAFFLIHQESISDFYWYYSGKDVIDEQGQRNFSKAINVAKQVFNTLTEYIQVLSFRGFVSRRDDRFQFLTSYLILSYLI